MSASQTGGGAPVPGPWPTIARRPLLGANGTEAVRDLLARGDAPAVDYLKVGPFMGQDAVANLASSYPLMLHLDDTLSDPAVLQASRVVAVNRWVSLTGTPWTSEHIGFGVAQTRLDADLVTQPLSELLPAPVALQSIAGNARALASNLAVPLLLENIPLFPNLAHLTVCQPAFITAVIETSGCGLLLDLAHARVSASVLGMDEREYLSALPLERVVELHIHGPRRLDECPPRLQAVVRENARGVAHLLRFDDAFLVDAHEPLLDDDYALLEWVLERTRPRAISLEYYRDAAALCDQLSRLSAMLGG